jgi:hypothetical protein
MFKTRPAMIPVDMTVLLNGRKNILQRFLNTFISLWMFSNTACCGSRTHSYLYGCSATQPTVVPEHVHIFLDVQQHILLWFLNTFISLWMFKTHPVVVPEHIHIFMDVQQHIPLLFLDTFISLWMFSNTACCGS